MAALCCDVGGLGITTPCFDFCGLGVPIGFLFSLGLGAGVSTGIPIGFLFSLGLGAGVSVSTFLGGVCPLTYLGKTFEASFIACDIVLLGLGVPVGLLFVFGSRIVTLGLGVPVGLLFIFALRIALAGVPVGVLLLDGLLILIRIAIFSP
jgi:hypothetical protein